MARTRQWLASLACGAASAWVAWHGGLASALMIGLLVTILALGMSDE